MASYSRIGNYLLATELGADLFGKIQRGLTLTGNGFDHHVLIRTFSQEIIDAGFSSKVDEVNRTASILNGQRNFCQGYRVEGGRTPHIVSEYMAGRSLAALVEKNRQEQLPLGIDHALALLQGIAQPIMQMHDKGLRHGILSPASVWVSFEGAVRLIDAPYAATLCSLLPRCRNTTAGLARYRGPAGTSAFQQDLYSLGAILFELLTLDKLPSQELINSTLAKATLKASQEDAPIPEPIMGLLKQLLGMGKTFESPSALNAMLEHVLYDGDYSPTTFNMAFFMHTLFRDENEADIEEMQEDRTADFAPFLDLEPEQRSIFETESGLNYAKYVYIGGALLISLAGYFGYRMWQSDAKNQEMQAEMTRLQRSFNESESRLRDLSSQESAAKERVAAKARALREARTEREKARFLREKEEQDRMLAEIRREREKTQKAQQEVQRASQALARSVRPEKSPEAWTQPAPIHTPPPTRPRPEPEPEPKAQPLPTPRQPFPAKPRESPIPLPPPTTHPTPSVQEPVHSESPATILKKIIPVVQRVANKDFLPPALRTSEIKVTVEVFVTSQGKPAKVSIKQGVPGNFPYNDAAKQAAYESLYAPATRNGKPVDSLITVDYNFGRPR